MVEAVVMAASAVSHWKEVNLPGRGFTDVA
jgi:hypothetical protein